ncbi:transposase [Xanthocytophaga flava]|uniref:transposase n=1 Tax=Xanthocytophaga flava TaxID=3048013 RepID=UPI0028D41231|nr:transposase [Xanthocytophaga flavus]MDJ1470236.1 transposase [Xanthocytophaga flavus]
MNTKKHKRLRRKYDQDFKVEVLKMLDSGQSASHISRSLGIGENLIYRWKKESKPPLPLPEMEGAAKLLQVMEENEALRKQLKRVEMERDILKKVVSIFSQTE